MDFVDSSCQVSTLAASCLRYRSEQTDKRHAAENPLPRPTSAWVSKHLAEVAAAADRCYRVGFQSVRKQSTYVFVDIVCRIAYTDLPGRRGQRLVCEWRAIIGVETTVASRRRLQQQKSPSSTAARGVRAVTVIQQQVSASHICPV